MHWLSIIVIGIAANLDNLGIGVSFGAKSTKIPFTSNLAISLLSMVAAFLSITIGNVISGYIPSSIANWGGGLLLFLIGLRGLKSDNITHSVRNSPGTTSKAATLLANPTQSDVDGNNILSIKESLSLGVALALNCIASGFGAGVTGLSPVASTLSIGIFSLITVSLGVRIGFHISKTWFGKYSNAIGNILLMIIGLYEIFV